MISARAKAALATAKVKGSGLVNPQIQVAQAKGTASTKAAADRFSANILPLVLPRKAQGKTLREIATALNERGVETARGETWAGTQVRDILSCTA